MSNEFIYPTFQAAIKNVAVDLKNVAEKTKKVEDVMGGLLKFGGQKDVKDVLSVVSVREKLIMH